MSPELRLIFATIDVFLSRHPLLLFQIVANVIHSKTLTYEGIVYLLAAAFSDSMWYRFKVNHIDADSLRDVVKFLLQYKDCTVRKLPPLNQVIGYELAKKVSATSIGRRLRVREIRVFAESALQGLSSSRDAAKRVHIYVIERASSSAAKPSSMVTFSFRVGGLIFLPDEPSRLRGVGAFIFYHELGHLSALGNYYGRVAKTASYSFTCVSAWAAVQTPFEKPYLAALTVFSLFFHLWLPACFFRFGVLAKWHEEVCADTFALNCLSENEIRRIAPWLRQHPMLDENLNASLNEARQDFLKKNILRLEGGGKEVAEPRWPVIPRSHWVGLGLIPLYAAVFTRPITQFSWTVALMMTGMLSTPALLKFSQACFYRRRLHRLLDRSI